MNDSMMIHIEKAIYASMDDENFFSPLTFSPGTAIASEGTAGLARLLVYTIHAYSILGLTLILFHNP